MAKTKDSAPEPQAPRNALNERLTLMGAGLVAAIVALIPANIYYKESPPNIVYAMPQQNRVVEPPKPGATDVRAAMSKLRGFTLKQRLIDCAVVLAILGGSLGLALGVTLGFIERSRNLAASAGVFCTCLGTVFGGIGGALGQWVYEQTLRAGGTDPLIMTIVAHAVAFTIMSLAIGLGMSFQSKGLEDLGMPVLVAGIGGLFAMILFTPLCSLIMPGAKIDTFVPTGIAARLLWFLLPSVSVAGCLSMHLIRPVALEKGRKKGEESSVAKDEGTEPRKRASKATSAQKTSS